MVQKHVNSTEHVNFIHFIFTLYTELSLITFEIFSSSFLWITFTLQLNRRNEIFMGPVRGQLFFLTQAKRTQ